MRNFYQLSDTVDPVPLLVQLRTNDHLWNQYTFRTTYPESPHTQVDDIWLRFQPDPEDFENVLDGKECVNYPALWALPACRTLIQGLMARVEGERLGRIMITRLPAGGAISAHVDLGDYAAYYDRFHVVLRGLPGSMFRCGDETLVMPTGTVWWFDNKKEHEVRNGSADDRIHMVVDIRTPHIHKFDADDASRDDQGHPERAGAPAGEALPAAGTKQG